MARRTVRAAVLTGVVPLAALMVTACGSNISLDNSRKQDNHSYTVPGRSLKIITDADVVVVPGSSGTVRASGWLTGRAADHGHHSVTFRGDTLRITIRCDGVDMGCASHYQLAVPPALPLRIATGYGEVSVRDLSGAVDIQDTSGAVELTKLTGTVRVGSQNGEITGSGLGSTDVLADSDNGDVRLTFDTTPDRVVVKSLNGGLSLVVPKGSYQVSAKSGSGEVRSSIADDPASSRSLIADTENGDVILRSGG